MGGEGKVGKGCRLVDWEVELYWMNWVGLKDIHNYKYGDKLLYSRVPLFGRHEVTTDIRYRID